MDFTKLFSDYKNLNLEKTDIVYDKINVKTIAEISLYKDIDNTEKDAELINGMDIQEKLIKVKTDGFTRLLVHYGHFFNADYDSVINYSEYIIKNFRGDLYFFSPEEIVFLSIRANKSYSEVIKDLVKIGVKNVFGYLPKTINESDYYANDDELFIDDRHHVLEALDKNSINYQYPFNPGQIDDDEDLKSVYQFIEDRSINNIVLQPNRLVEDHEKFNYEQAQLLGIALFGKISVPLYMLGREDKLYCKDGLFKHYYFDNKNNLITDNVINKIKTIIV